MHFAFADQEAEQLYMEYYSNEKRNDFRALIVIVIVVNVVLLLLRLVGSGSVTTGQLVTLGVCLATSVALYVLCTKRARDELSSHLWSAIAVVLWLVMVAQVVCDLWLFTGAGHRPEPSGAVCWLILYTYATYVVFPVRYRICVALACLMAIVHFVCVLALAEDVYLFSYQVSVFSKIIVSAYLNTCVLS